MSRLLVALLPALLLLSACSSPKQQHVSPTATVAPATAVAARTATSQVPTAAVAAPTTRAATASPAGVSFPAVTATTVSPPATVTAVTASVTPAAPVQATPPIPPPPPPPPPPARGGQGGRDSTGSTLPVGVLCPLGFPIKGDASTRAYRQNDAEYNAIGPVACFQTMEDAITAGYTPAHP